MGYSYKTEPYDHQRKVLNRSWTRRYFGLLMRMGTGKTKVIIDNIAALWDNGHCYEALILAPKSVARNWLDEMEVHMPDRVVYLADTWAAGMGKGRTKELELLQQRDDGVLRIVIMNLEGIYRENAYEYARRFLKSSGASFMAVDESVMIKSHKAKRSIAARELGQLAHRRRILTGQPVPQGPLDLYAQCEFLQPGCLGYPTYTAFKAEYAITKLVDLGGRKKFEMIMGYRNIADLQARMAPFVAIVSKEECLDLPPKVFKRMDVTMSKAQQRAYDDMYNDSIAQLDDGTLCTAQEILTRMLRQHQITCGYLQSDDGVMQPLENNRLKLLLDEYMPNVDGPCIIWTHFTHSVEEITIALQERYGEDAVAAFYGAVKQDDRQDIVRRFQNPKDPLRIIVANKTMAYGVTLTAATNVLYYTNQWSLDVREQSEDRAHRSGLTHSVTYTDFVCPGTIDDDILGALLGKSDVARQVLANPRRYARAK